MKKISDFLKDTNGRPFEKKGSALSKKTASIIKLCGVNRQYDNYLDDIAEKIGGHPTRSGFNLNSAVIRNLKSRLQTALQKLRSRQ